MPEDFRWRTEYAIGVEDIDLQHQFFVALINRVGRELDQSLSKATVMSLFQEVVLYAQFHFFSEENVMSRWAFPLFDEHRELHGALIDDLTRLRISFENEHLEGSAVRSFLKNWFLDHTLHEDRKFGQFMREPE